MAQNDSQPLTDEERAELEQLRADKARREAEEQARREREELAALRAEKARAEAPKSVSAQVSSKSAAQQPRCSASSQQSASSKALSHDEMTFAQRMVVSEAPKGEDELPGMPPAQKIIIVFAIIAFAIFMGYTLMNRMGLLG